MASPAPRTRVRTGVLGAVSLLAVGLSTLTPTPALAATSTPPSTPGVIAFQQGVIVLDPSQTLYTSALDGSQVRESAGANLGEPTLSADGTRRLAVRTNYTPGSFTATLVASDARGNNPVDVYSYPAGVSPALAYTWSKDDQSVYGLRYSEDGVRTSIDHITLATGTNAAITGVPASSSSAFAIDPTGRIAILSEKGVEVLHPDGTPDHLVVAAPSNSAGYFQGLSLGSDGVTLTYSHYTYQGAGGVPTTTLDQAGIDSGAPHAYTQISDPVVSLAADPSGAGVYYLGPDFRSIEYVTQGASPVKVITATSTLPEFSVGAGDPTGGNSTIPMAVSNVVVAPRTSTGFSVSFTPGSDPDYASTLVRIAKAGEVGPYTIRSGALLADVDKSVTSYTTRSLPGTYHLILIGENTTRNAAPAAVVEVNVTAPAGFTLAPVKNVTYGGSTLLRATIVNATKDNVAGAPVELWARPAGGNFTKVASLVSSATTTGSNLAVTVSPRVSTEYQWRFQGNRSDLGANNYLSDGASGPQKVGVTPTLSAHFTSGQVARSHPTRLVGSVHPTLAGEVISIQRLTGGGWTTVATTRIGSTGGWGVTLRPGSPGRFGYRAYLYANGSHLAAASARQNLTVG